MSYKSPTKLRTLREETAEFVDTNQLNKPIFASVILGKASCVPMFAPVLGLTATR